MDQPNACGSAPARLGNIVRDAAFAARLKAACDSNHQVPPMHHGRLVWIRNGLESSFGLGMSLESVRKWMSGITRPRPATMARLAQLLQVDESWLSIAVVPEMSTRDRKTRNNFASGAVNVFAGFLQMGGGYPAFPKEDDARSILDGVDVYATIQGASYAFHVEVGAPSESGIIFSAPLRHEGVIVIGVIPVENQFCVEFCEITPALIASHGVHKGARFDVELSREEICECRIKSFANRI